MLPKDFFLEQNNGMQARMHLLYDPQCAVGRKETNCKPDFAFVVAMPLNLLADAETILLS